MIMGVLSFIVGFCGFLIYASIALKMTVIAVILGAGYYSIYRIKRGFQAFLSNLIFQSKEESAIATPVPPKRKITKEPVRWSHWRY